jgi:biopolymer transport protein TolR
VSGGSRDADRRARRAVTASLQLAPFVDVLTVLVTFLVFTSVWPQVTALDVGPPPYCRGGEPRPPEAPPLMVRVRASGYVVTRRGAAPRTIEKRGDAYDTRALGAAFDEARGRDPENLEVTIASEDHVAYSAVVGVMDEALAHRLTTLSLVVDELD